MGAGERLHRMRVIHGADAPWLDSCDEHRNEGEGGIAGVRLVGFILPAYCASLSNAPRLHGLSPFWLAMSSTFQPPCSRTRV
ncbi:hypothetical protein CO665_03400 [Rhizobium anhuiense]|nr:hypothetical protein CO665_03400 [Rhizobium anhuiense]